MLSGAFLLRDYFFPQLQVILAMLVAPFVFKIRKQSAPVSRYFYLSLLFTGIYYILCMKLFLFLGIGCLLFYSIENNFGKIGFLPFIFLVSISPALHYVVTLFTFTLRLWLSHYAAGLLNAIHVNVTCCGNYFILADGFTFNVDKACLGLNMFNTGLALTCLLIGLSESKQLKSLPVLQLMITFISACLLLIVANFLRIIMIVLFRSMPGTASHELIGMFSLIAYMAAPVYFLITRLLKRYGTLPVEYAPGRFSGWQYSVALPAIAFACLFFSFTSVEHSLKTVVRDQKLETLQLEGFYKLKKEDGVMEYRRDSLLVYIKPAIKMFESDHPPALCWRGSGFDVEQVSEIEVLHYKVLMATIKKGNKTQYTAWWYDNGLIKTDSQWHWRMAKGEPFRIINITATTKKELLLNCRLFLSKKLF